MNIRQLILVNNDCYKAGKTIKPRGIMLHSTGANNPSLKRYVNPDDGKLGKNLYGNHWNKSGLSVCAHAFIGKLADGTIATYQTLPWNHRGWHAGGSANDTHIGFEICEDGLKDASYFNAVYKEAVELCVYLCKQYGLKPEDIICHSEGYKKGIASNHADVMHWFTKHGNTMDSFRAAVKSAIEQAEKPTPAHVKPIEPVKPAPAPVPSPAPKPAETLRVGDNVKATGVYYTTGQKIPAWIKLLPLYVRQIGDGKVLVSRSKTGTAYTGWIKTDELKKV